MAFAIFDGLVKDHTLQLDFDTAVRNYIKAVDKGLLKVMSKMGISTLTSYKGAQLFEAVGLSREFCRRYLGDTVSKISGVDIDRIYSDIRRAHSEAFADDFDQEAKLPDIGQLSYRKGGEAHAWNPKSNSDSPQQSPAHIHPRLPRLQERQSRSGRRG